MFMLLTVVAALLPQTSFAGSCPVISLRETALDCPWAEMTRDIEAKSSAASQLAVLKSAPDFFRTIESDRENPWFKLWGTSVNFDELVKQIIINPSFLNALERELRISAPAGSAEHNLANAGAAHTYGYLFSNLLTSFGYKRARWVKPTLEEGFELQSGTIAPIPNEGTMFSNVTYLAGRIAFRNEREQLDRLERYKSHAAKAVRDLDYSKLIAARITETAELTKSRTVVLRTDLVPFSRSRTLESNTHLLIYSVHDSKDGGPKLITVFPIERSFAQKTCDRARMGHNRSITAQYNAYVQGLSGQTVKGRRQQKGCAQL